MHPIGGSVTAYARLASMLDDDQLVYAMEDPAVHGTASSSSTHAHAA
jgi:thioesterase domain-containing protein